MISTRGSSAATALVLAGLGALGCAARPVVPARTSACAPTVARGSSFELVVLGSGGPKSFGRAASGYVVLVDGVARVLVDAGPGAFVRLGELGIDLGALDIVLLTHLHVDHAGDLPGFVKSRDLGEDEAMTFRIFGPSGAGPYPPTTAFVERLFGASGAFAYLPTFRNRVLFAVTDLPSAPCGEPREILRDGDMTITSIAVDHDDVPAVAFRIERAGRGVVVTGDLASRNDAVARLARGADVLVYDATVVDPPGSPPKLYDLHTSPHRIGEIAAQAQVKRVVLSHLSQGVVESERAVLASVHATFRGDATLATDCLRIDLAAR
jgi:ribonuclease BN (tRNA processing enzyme)